TAATKNENGGNTSRHVHRFLFLSWMQLLRSSFLWRQLLGRCACARSFFGARPSAGSAEERQSILGIEREFANRLFSRRAQHNVHAPVVSQAHRQYISQDSLFLRGRQVAVG